MEDIWEEIDELKAVVEELKFTCASIQRYFEYLSDPIEAVEENFEKDGTVNSSDKLEVFNIFKTVETMNNKNVDKENTLTDIFGTPDIDINQVDEKLEKRKFAEENANDEKFELNETFKSVRKNHFKLSRKKRKFAGDENIKQNIKQNPSVVDDINKKKITWRDNIFSDSEDESCGGGEITEGEIEKSKNEIKAAKGTKSKPNKRWRRGKITIKGCFYYFSH